MKNLRNLKIAFTIDNKHYCEIEEDIYCSATFHFDWNDNIEVKHEEPSKR